MDMNEYYQLVINEVNPLLYGDKRNLFTKMQNMQNEWVDFQLRGMEYAGNQFEQLLLFLGHESSH